MATLSKGALATALATAMAVIPSLAPAQERVAAKPASGTTVSLPQDDQPFLHNKVVDYSKTHPVVVIGIYKGSKDSITAEKVGETLSKVLQNAYQGTPSKYFAEPGADHTAIIFAVAGHLYGPYSLKESLLTIGVAADNYASKVQRGIFPPPDKALLPSSTPANSFAAKPEPQQ